MIIVYKTTIELQNKNEVLRFFKRVLHSDVISQSERYRKIEDRLRYLSGRWLLLTALTEQGFPSNSLEMLKFDQYKRPWINSSVDFNITHSGDIIACAISRKSRVGIDVEQINTLDWENFEDALSDKEKMILNCSNEPITDFYTLWTRKEAVMKANGKGIYTPINELEASGYTVDCEGKTWSLRTLDFGVNYSCHLAFDIASNIEIKELFPSTIK